MRHQLCSKYKWSTRQQSDVHLGCMTKGCVIKLVVRQVGPAPRAAAAGSVGDQPRHVSPAQNGLPEKYPSSCPGDI